MFKLLTYPTSSFTRLSGLRRLFTRWPIPGTGPTILLHVGQEVVHGHLIIDGILEATAGIGHRSTEPRADHDHAGRHRL